MGVALQQARARIGRFSGINRLTFALAACLSAAPALAQEGGAANRPTVDDIVVIGSGAIGRVNGSDRTSELMSQSSVVLDRSALDDYGVRRLADALELVSGISQQNNLGGMRDNYAIRGFLGTPDSGAEYYVDGFTANRGFGPPRDPANVEQTEVLKGPAGAIFGSVDPAGLVNIVTKKAAFRNALSATASAGSFGTWRLEADGEFMLGETLSARLVGAYEDSDGWRDHVDLRRRLFAPSISWAPAAGTRFSYQGEYIRFAAPFDRGLPAVDGNAEAVPRRTYLGEPADGRVASRNWRHQVTGEQELGGSWRLVGGVAYRDARLNGFSSESSTLLADGTLRRQRRYRDWNLTDLSGRLELRGRVEAFGAHSLSIGATAYDLDFDTYQTRFRPSAAQPYAINIFDPVHGAVAGALAPNTDTNERRKNVALYVQDMWEATDRLSFVGGIRYDHLDQTISNRLTDLASVTKRNPVDFRAGVRYRMSDQLAFHANWGEGFRANSSVGRLDNVFGPETGHGYEVGAKLALPGARAAITWFGVSKRNLLASDPVDPNYLAAVGSVTSHGIELDGEIELTRTWRLIGNYAFTDAEASDPDYPTSAVLNVPRHAGTVQLFASIPAAGRPLDLSVGGVYVGPRSGALDGGNLRLDGYVKAKASVSYALTDALTARVEVDNIFDTTYSMNSYSALWIYPGAPRSVMAALTMRY